MSQQPNVKEVAVSVGKFIEYWGFKHIHGRIWTTVFLSRSPVSSTELVKLLGVSKGLISIAVNELIEYGLIFKSDKTIYGGQTYKATEDIGTIIRSVLRQRELIMLKESETALETLAAHSAEELENSNISVNKLHDLIQLTQSNKQLLTTFISKNFTTLEDWKQFTNKAHQLLKLHK